jgi:hypothetical protein
MNLSGYNQAKIEELETRRRGQRPDEKTTNAEISRAQKRDSNLKSGLKTAGSLALGASTAKILPFLNEHLPIDLAKKGISKIFPQVGKFLDKGVKEGLSLKAGLDYLKEQISPQRENPKQELNVIQQHSPELFDFLKEKIGGGLTPLQAGALAQVDKRFQESIKKISKSSKLPWANLLESVFGSEGTQMATGAQEGQAQGPQRQGQQPMQSQQGQGQGAQALQAILQRINQSLGG